LSASKDNPKVTREYEHEKPGKLRFVLDFAPEGDAKLRLTVKTPTGKVATQEDTEGFFIDFPDAPAGRWEYTVEGLNLPRADFEFKVQTVEPTATQKYRNTKPGKLRFALAFNPEGNARLRLTVKTPDGKIARHEDTEGFIIEFPDARLGDW